MPLGNDIECTARYLRLMAIRIRDSRDNYRMWSVWMILCCASRCGLSTVVEKLKNAWMIRCTQTTDEIFKALPWREKKKKGKEDEMISEKGICFKKRKPESHLVKGGSMALFQSSPRVWSIHTHQTPKGISTGHPAISPISQRTIYYSMKSFDSDIAQTP